MRSLRSAFLAGTLSLVTCGAMYAQGNPDSGRDLAREWCTRCHDVEPGGQFKMHPPSFAAIAVFRSSDQILARIAFPPLHVSMPQIAYILTPQNIDDLVAYIVSLESD